MVRYLRGHDDAKCSNVAWPILIANMEHWVSKMYGHLDNPEPAAAVLPDSPEERDTSGDFVNDEPVLLVGEGTHGSFEGIPSSVRDYLYWDNEMLTNLPFYFSCVSEEGTVSGSLLRPSARQNGSPAEPLCASSASSL